MMAMPMVSARDILLADYLAWEWVLDPQISHKGKHIIYTRKYVNAQEDRIDSELWIMQSNGSNKKSLHLENIQNPIWSPDGTALAYIASTEMGQDIFIRQMDDSGKTKRLTFDGYISSGISWSPNSKMIAYRSLVPLVSEWTITLPKPPQANWVEDALVIDSLHYRRDGVGFLAPGYAHIFTVGVDSGTIRQITQGKWHAGEKYIGHDAGGTIEWAKDSQSIIFSADKQPDAELMVARAAIYRTDIKTSNTERLTNNIEYAIQARVSPSGEYIAYVGADKTAQSNFPDRQIRIVKTDGTADRLLLDNIPDNNIKIFWSKDNQGLYFTYAEKGTHNLNYLSLEGKKSAVTYGNNSFTLSSISDHGLLVGTLTNETLTGDIVSINADLDNLQHLTTVNQQLLKEIKLGHIEEIWYDSSESTRIQGWIVYPPNFDPKKKYPLILDVHGGPELMYTGNWYYPNIHFSRHELAAQGYIVFYANPRGSTGYSGDFSRAIYNAYPGQRDYDDLMFGVESVVKKGYINESRLYIQGCSGGGILTAWAISKTNRFAAAAAMCPTVNTISKTGASDIPIWNYNRFKKKFWEDPETWLAHSTIMYANKITTPTLIVVGENDIRTTVSQANEFYSALKVLRIPTKLIMLREESHASWLYSLSGKPSNFMRTQLYMKKWFGEWHRLNKYPQKRRNKLHE